MNIYNQQDHQALYAIFNEQAKVKINYQQLKNQLKNLFYLFGKIEESAFVSADKIGQKGDETYYKLIFNLRVKETSNRPATLTISVITRDKSVSLYGVRINASQPLDWMIIFSSVSRAGFDYIKYSLVAVDAIIGG